MTEIRALGRRPRRGQNVDAKESSLAERLRWWERKNLFSASHLAELEQMPGCTLPVDSAETLMQEIRDLGHTPQWRKKKRHRSHIV